MSDLKRFNIVKQGQDAYVNDYNDNGMFVHACDAIPLIEQLRAELADAKRVAKCESDIAAQALSELTAAREQIGRMEKDAEILKCALIEIKHLNGALINVDNIDCIIDAAIEQAGGADHFPDVRKMVEIG